MGRRRDFLPPGCRSWAGGLHVPFSPFLVPFPAAGPLMSSGSGHRRHPPPSCGVRGRTVHCGDIGAHGFFPLVALAVGFLFSLGSPSARASGTDRTSAHAKVSVSAWD